LLDPALGLAMSCSAGLSSTEWGEPGDVVPGDVVGGSGSKLLGHGNLGTVHCDLECGEWWLKVSRHGVD
jgi:hypothetical protein